MNVVVRPATDQDLPAIKRRQAQLLPAAPIDWDQHIVGDILLVAERPNGSSVGHLVAARAKFESYQIIQSRVKGDLPVPPWIKLLALAVDSDSQRSGIGNALYKGLLARAPKETCGIYGNVDETSIQAINFYRRHGFFLSPSYTLTDRERAGIGAQYGAYILSRFRDFCFSMPVFRPPCATPTYGRALLRNRRSPRLKPIERSP